MNLYLIHSLLAPLQYICGAISIALGATSRPTCFTQYFWWIANSLPVGANIHILGIATLGNLENEEQDMF